jgi:hypothetical protein
MTQLISSDFFIPLNFQDVWSEMDNLDISKISKLTGIHPFFNADNFKVPNTILEILKDVGLTIFPKATLLFHCKPLAAGPIHTDGYHHTNNHTNYRLTVLNWTWFGENTLMHWYKSTAEPTKSRRMFGVETPIFDHTNTEKIYSTELVGCNLVNVTYPHQVTNNSVNTRYTLSIAFEENPTWEEASELFKKYSSIPN